jgi:dTDP-4-dehydrorhamnose 3,5-epimerase-like enzyme
VNLFEPKLFSEEIFRDHRGTIASFNLLDLSSFKRTYFITHPNTTIIRAWQGHPHEAKLFRVTKGAFAVGFVQIDDFQHPSNDLKADYQILTENRNEFFLIPKGYANGLKALQDNSTIQVFSDFYLDESINEKIRFSPDNWLNWNTINL